MENYKCPICGNSEYVEADILSSNTGAVETVYDKKYGNLTRGEKHHSFLARGLINYTCSAKSNDCFVDVELLFKNNCTTKVCTNCGFVSLHALNVAQGIIEDQMAIKEQIEALTKTRDALCSELEELKVEQNNLPKKEEELKNKIQDENITVKQQKELQILLEETKQRAKRMPSFINDKEQDIRIVEVRIGFISKSSDYIKGHKVTD